MRETPECDIILVSWNKLEFLKPCVESIIENTNSPYRLILVDNASSAETINYLEGFESKEGLALTLVKNIDNLGWTKAINQGIRKSSAPYVCFLNNDCIVMKGWLKAMLDIAMSVDAIGLLNPTYNKNGQRLADFKGRLHTSGVCNKVMVPYIELNECNGACMLVKREVIDRIGGLDEVFGMGGMDDSDFSRRATKAGFRCACAKNSYVFHWENASTNSVTGYWQRLRRENEKIFMQRWGARKQVVFIMDGTGHLRERDIIEQMKGCLLLARLGVRFHIWLRVNRNAPVRDVFYRFDKGIPEHNNMKYLFKRIPRQLFILLCLVKLISRRFKKPDDRIKTVFCRDKDIFKYLKRFRWFHNAEITEDFSKWKDSPLCS